MTSRSGLSALLFMLLFPHEFSINRAQIGHGFLLMRHRQEERDHDDRLRRSRRTPPSTKAPLENAIREACWLALPGHIMMDGRCRRWLGGAAALRSAARGQPGLRPLRRPLGPNSRSSGGAGCFFCFQPFAAACTPPRHLPLVRPALGARFGRDRRRGNTGAAEVTFSADSIRISRWRPTLLARRR